MANPIEPSCFRPILWEEETQAPDDIVIDIVQDGARLHYALPIALKRRGVLGTVYTDWFVKPGSKEEKITRLVQTIMPALGRRMADRRCHELNVSHVRSSIMLAVQRHVASLRPAQRLEEQHLRLARNVARWVCRQGWRGSNAIVGFVRNIHPDLCTAAAAHGLLTIVDQIIAPADVEIAEAAAQARRWPGWRSQPPYADPDLLLRLERQTWAAADHVTCPSAYVRDGLLRQGIPEAKISIIPYPIDNSAFPFIDRRGRDERRLTVGFVGSVGLRKGAPTFLEVARSRPRDGLHFVMVGPIALPQAEIGTLREHVTLTGQVSRGEVQKYLEQFDVFFFPSTCEGSAGAVMEAMATGLPVLTTPNSGTVVRHGIEGFLCASDDVAGFTRYLERLCNDRELRLRMGRAACRRARMFDLDHYGQAFHNLLAGLLDKRASRLQQRRASDRADCGDR